MNRPDPITQYFEASVAFDSHLRLNGINRRDPKYQDLSAAVELSLRAAKIRARRCLHCGEPVGQQRGKSRYCSNACLEADRAPWPVPEINCPFASGEIELEGGYQPDPMWGY